MNRRILENDSARGDFNAGLDQLDDRTPCRTEGVMVDQRSIDIVVPAQGVKVVLCVAVQRRLFA
jgi:hypothetical protein